MIHIGMKDGLFVPPTTPGAQVICVCDMVPDPSSEDELDFVESLAFGLMRLYEFTAKGFNNCDARLKRLQQQIGEYGWFLDYHEEVND